MNAVEVAGVSHVYRKTRSTPERRALNEVSFSVPEGELFGLLGPNGGGKSTLFKILSTMFPPSAGHVVCFGTDLVARPEDVRASLGIVFQSPSLDARLSVLENMTHSGRLYGLQGRRLSARVDEMLSRYRLTDRAADRVSTLSGGLKRRVELAKSLLHAPRLVLLDEPSTGLDPAARKDLWEHLLALKKDGATVMTTTHLMDEGDRCDRVGILDAGKLVALGAPEALKSKIGGDVVTVETEDAPALAAAMKQRFGGAPEAFGGTVRLEREAGHAFIPQLVEAFPGKLKTVSLSRPSLEDVFLHHAGRRFADAEAAS
jgi:ABC-2 type transport system ATP-binding protein